METACLGCDEEFSLSEKLHEQFKGEVKCPQCGSRLHVALKDGKILRLRLVEQGRKKGEELYQRLHELSK